MIGEDPYSTVWLGATDEEEEGVWVWANGEPWSFTNWELGEPNNCHNGPDNCVPEHYLTFWQYDNSKWNDIIDADLPFICEWEPGSE
jgi:hypothetical protein